MRECSVFVDESGGQDGRSKYYIVTLVVHDQAESLVRPIMLYEQALKDHGLEDIPFHASPLMNGHDAYKNLSLATRKKMFSVFFVFLRHLPVCYKSFLYRRKDIGDSIDFANRIRRDLVVFLFDELELFQSFDSVKVYYDGGQRIVSRALEDAFGYALAKGSALHRKASPADYRLAQAADFLCAIELAACKYANGEQTATDEKFFGSHAAFKNNYLKAVKRKRM